MPIGTTVGDVDDDGLADFVATRPSLGGSASTVTWRRNLGSGAFSQEVSLFSAFGESSVTLADVNGDGATDILLNQVGMVFAATAVTAGAQYSLLTSTGIDSLDPDQRLTALDLNLDGRKDVTGALDSSFPLVWVNPGASGFATAELIFPGVPVSRSARFGDLDGDGDLDAVSIAGRRIWIAENETSRVIGTNVCGPATPNSLGVPASMAALGSLDVSDMDVTLLAQNVPFNVTGLFLVSSSVGAPMPLAGSQGTLCLTGSVGRFNRPAEIQNTGIFGSSMVLAIDVSSVPQGSARVPILPGETWHFQGWFRDSIFPTGATSNLTDAISITF